MPKFTWDEIKQEQDERPQRGRAAQRKELNGWFDAQLTGIDAKESKNGAPQLVFSFDVTDNDGDMHQLRNWVTFSGSEVGTQIAMRDCMDMGLPPSEGPEVAFNPEKNCHDCDVDQIASTLLEVSEYTEGAGYRVRVKTEKDETYGTTHRIVAMNCPEESAVAWLTRTTTPSKPIAPSVEGRTPLKL